MALPYPKLSEPIIRTPFTDMGAAMITQQRSICKSFELKFMQCMEAYGKSIGDVKCKDYFDDLQECTLLSKQSMRGRLIQIEKNRQIKEEGKQFPLNPRPSDCF